MDRQLTVEYEKETGAPFIDSLTGLFNHGFFQISLEREIIRSTRHSEIFTLALIDIDSFYLNEKIKISELDNIIKDLHELLIREFHRNITNKFIDFLRSED